MTAFKARSAATGLAVAVGAAFLAGTLVLTDTSRAALNRTVLSSLVNTDLYVRAKPAGAGLTGEQRPRIQASIAQRIAAIDGVAAAEARVEGYAQVFDRRGTPIGRPAEAVGANWSGRDAFRIVDGRIPSAEDEVVLDRRIAKASRHAVGDRVKVATNAGPVSVAVTGIAGSDGTSADEKWRVFFAQTAAERLLAQPGRVDGVVVVAAPGVSAQSLRARIGTVLSDDLEVVTPTMLALESGALSGGVTKAIRTLLLAFAAMALFVSAFVISNTFSILVAQRTTDVARIRILGATRGQVHRSVLAEAAIIGLVGATVGTLAGAAAAGTLRVLVAGFGVDLPPGPTVVRAVSLITPVVVGTVVAVGSAVLPAARAAAAPPLAALRDAAVDTPKRPRRRVIAGVVLMTVGTALVVVPIAAGQSAPGPIGLGAAAAFLGLAALGPSLVAPFVSVVTGRAGALGGVPAKIAGENAARNARRTSGAAASLTIGVALVTLIAVFASSAKATISRPYAAAAATRPHFVIQPAASDMMGFSSTLATRLRALAEIESVGVARAAAVEVGGHRLLVHGADAEWGVMSGAVPVASAFPRHGEISVLEDEARMRGWSTGSAVTLRFVDRAHDVRVSSLRASGPPLLVNLHTYQDLVPEQLDMVVLARRDLGVSMRSAEGAVDRLLREYPTATLLDAKGRSSQQDASIDQFADAVYVVLGLALLVSLAGVGTTLGLSVAERTREIGLLRSIGMTGREVRSMIRWESLLIVLFGSGVGVVSGLVFGWVGLQAMPDNAAFRVPLAQLAAFVALAAAAAVVAAAGPGRRASRLPVLAALGRA